MPDPKESDGGTKKNDVLERAEILLGQCNLVYNRLNDKIITLRGRLYSLLAILISTITLQITLLQILLSITGESLPIYYYIIFMSLFLLPMIYSIIKLFQLIKPSIEYADVAILETERLDELSGFDKKSLLSTLLADLKKIYDENLGIYEKDVKQLERIIISLIIGNIVFVAIVVSIWIIYNWT